MGLFSFLTGKKDDDTATATAEPPRESAPSANITRMGTAHRTEDSLSTDHARARFALSSAY